MGLLNRPVIPEGWEEHHRPVADATMTAVCDIILPGVRTSITDESAGTVVASSVKCRVQQQQRAVNGAGAGQEASTRQYLVTMPHDVGVDFQTGAGGHRIRIASANNNRIIGHEFLIMQVLKGSLIWETDLYCEDDLTQNEGRVTGL